MTQDETFAALVAVLGVTDAMIRGSFAARISGEARAFMTSGQAAHLARFRAWWDTIFPSPPRLAQIAEFWPQFTAEVLERERAWAEEDAAHRRIAAQNRVRLGSHALRCRYYQDRRASTAEVRRQEAQHAYLRANGADPAIVAVGPVSEWVIADAVRAAVSELRKIVTSDPPPHSGPSAETSPQWTG